jgi:hypothetical protein
MVWDRWKGDHACPSISFPRKMGNGQKKEVERVINQPPLKLRQVTLLPVDLLSLYLFYAATHQSVFEASAFVRFSSNVSPASSDSVLR